MDTPRCMFVDGPLLVYISTGTEEEINDAALRLVRVIAVAAKLMQKGEESHVHIDGQFHVDHPTAAKTGEPT